MKKKALIITITFMMAMMIFNVYKVKAASVTPTIDAYEVVNCWDGNKEWVDDGAKITLPGGVADAWNRRADILANDTYGPLFKIDDGQTVSMSFSINLFDTDGTILSKSNNSTALDIYVMNKANDSEIMLLRIWTDSGSYNNGNHSYEIYPIFGDWGTVIYGSNWIAGDMMSSSEILVQFSKANLFESFVGGSSEVTRLDNADALLDYRYRLDDIDQIYFRIGGDNGFTADTDVVIKSINGQSLANTTGTFDDDVAPIIDLGDVNATIIEDQAYVIPVNAYDLLGNPVSFSILDESDNVLSNDNTYTPTDSGSQTVTLVATDAAGNISEEDITFNVTNTIDPPVLSNVPTLTDETVDYFSKLSFASPTVTEETGVYDLTLNIYNQTDLVNPVYVLDTLNDSDEFELVITEDFVTGDYVFIYEATNEAGTTESASQTITLTTNSLYNDTFFVSDAGMSDYTDNGIRCRTVDDTIFTIGEFDMEYGFDIKFTVRESSTNLNNDGTNGYIELVLMDPENPLNNITLRVWLDIVNVDNPTNIFIHYDGEDEIDLPNAGWISNSVDEETMQFHMYFDLDAYFSADRLSGKAAADVGQTEIATFLSTLSSTELLVGMRQYSLTNTNFFEFVVTEINGQSMTSTDGVLDSLQDAMIANKTEISENALVDEALEFDIYVNDLYQEANYQVEITLPDESVVTVEDLTGLYSYTPDQLGTYTFTFTVTGLSGNEVSLEAITINVKDKISQPTVTLTEDYLSSYTLNQTIQIINANFSSDVVTSTIQVVVTNPLGEEETVTMASDYTFAIPGIYYIEYSGQDNANPEPNQVKVSFTINVPDDVLPVITVNDMIETTVINKEVVIEDIVITEDSTYTLTVTLIDPFGNEEELTLTDNKITFTPDETGDWQLEISVNDLYDNQITETYDFTVKTLSTGGLIGIISGSIVVLAGILSFVILSKRH